MRNWGGDGDVFCKLKGTMNVNKSNQYLLLKIARIY